ncbi:hypothetical protein [Aquimarina sp. MMG016]|uniref:hypothetical protein n=1 Tax=Aquimarina sp. MMG016 TaxID=2822690 RepID=UPI001B3A01DB|nr:hypothetical protein [Aquimarina sp. MMG016]MBQ4818755.1 hypothetical protein [Aquimarina sp. MMG016]
MKKLTNHTLRILLAGLLILFIGSCTGEHGNEQYIKQIKELKEQIAELQEQLGQVNDSKPKNIITSVQARKLYDNYARKRVKFIDSLVGKGPDGKPFEATRSLFYDLDSLKNYLAYINRISKKAGVEPSGLRFYFGVYADDYVRRNNKGYAKRQTFFIAPTLPKTIEGKTRQVGYTISDDFKVEFLTNKIGLDSRTGNVYSKSKLQQAGLFNFSAIVDDELNSTLGNEFGSSPPIGDN